MLHLSSLFGCACLLPSFLCWYLLENIQQLREQISSKTTEKHANEKVAKKQEQARKEIEEKIGAVHQETEQLLTSEQKLNQELDALKEEKQRLEEGQGLLLPCLSPLCFPQPAMQNADTLALSLSFSLSCFDWGQRSKLSRRSKRARLLARHKALSGTKSDLAGA